MAALSHKPVSVKRRDGRERREERDGREGQRQKRLLTRIKADEKSKDQSG